MKYILITVIGICMTLPAFASTSQAAMTEKDVLVITRLISLLQNRPQDKVIIAVVANTPNSRTDADFLSHILHKQQMHGLDFTATQLSPEELANSGADVVIIPDYFDMAQLDTVFNIALKEKMVTISTSQSCLVAQRCAIAFKSEPAVDIRMSQAVATATDIRFSSTLHMMIKEVP